MTLLGSGLTKLTAQIPDILSRQNYNCTLDRFTYFKDLNREEVLEFEECLKDRFNGENKSFSKYLSRYPGKTDIFHISSIIRLAFHLQLSFEEFRTLAYLAGYSFEKNTPYPPYFLLRLMLERLCFEYSQYKKALTNTDFIKSVLKETDILKIYFFREIYLKAFFQKNNQKYKMSYNDALKDLNFQADFLAFFLESVYITGSVTENRRIDAI